VSVSVRTSANKHQDWGDAVDLPVFYGRTAELETLEQWIVQDHCRLVGLFGMGGIGKTALAVSMTQRIQDQFEFLFWRSLRNAPPVQDLLAELIQFLSQQQEIALPETVEGRVLRVIEYLRSWRCLLILDNAETILSSGESTGCYREGYSGYGQLLRCVAETAHHSCLLLTSREQPRGWEVRAGATLPARSLQLTGLPIATAREMFRARGEFMASEAEWRALVEHYAGNPLALKMVAPAIRDLFDSRVARFLELLAQGTLVFQDIRNLLDRQFERLTDLETEVMYWLALEREPVAFPDLQADFVSNVRPGEILEALQYFSVKL